MTYRFLSLSLILLAINACSQPPEPPRHRSCNSGESVFAGNSLLRTRSLGIEFVQDGTPALLYSGPSRYLTTKLKRKPFEIRVPEANWPSRDSEYPVVQIAVDPNLEIFDKVAINEAKTATDMFGVGTGLAAYDWGSGYLASSFKKTQISNNSVADWKRHNYLIGNRLDLASDDYRGAYVSAIFGQNDEENTNYIEEGDAAFMVIYMNVDPEDKGQEDIIKVSEIACVQLIFED